MTATGRRLTLNELLALPEEKPAIEYVDGQVTQKIASETWHGLVRGDLIRAIA